MYINSYFVILVLKSQYFFAVILTNDCPKFQFIQQLDESIGLSYVIIAGGKYFLIKDSNDDNDSALIEPIDDMPKGYENPDGIMAHENRNCPQPQYHLLVYKVHIINWQVFDYHIKLDLINWKSNTKWTKQAYGLPDYLQNDNFMNSYRLTSTFYWPQRNSIVIIQLPVRGAPEQTFLYQYHFIRILPSCPPNFTYTNDESEKIKITEVLKPYNDFDTCFVHNNTQIICVGKQGINSFDIDFDKTQDGKLRVKSSKTVEKLPIIEKICNWFSPKPKPTITTTGSSISITTTDKTTLEASGDEDSKLGLWIIIIFIILFLIAMVLTISFCFYKKKFKKEGNEDDFQSNIQGLSTDSNVSNTSVRSEANDLSKRRTGKGLTVYENTTSELSIRSHAFDKNKDIKINEKSSIDSHVSMRSQTNTDKKQSSPNALENASTLGTEASMRSLAQPNNKIDPQNLDNKTTSMVSVRTIAKN